MGASVPFPITGNIIQLAKLDRLLTSPGALEFLVGRAMIPSMPGGLPVLAHNAQLRRGSTSSGSVGVPVAIVNGSCNVVAQRIAFGSLKCLFR